MYQGCWIAITQEIYRRSLNSCCYTEYLVTFSNCLEVGVERSNACSGDIWLAFFLSVKHAVWSLVKGKIPVFNTITPCPPAACLFIFPHQRGQNCLLWSLTGTVETLLQGSFSCVQLTAGNWMLVWKWKDFNELGVFMGLVFLAAINSRGCTEGQKLFFWGVSRTSLSDKIKLMCLLVLISKAAGCCNVFGMADTEKELMVIYYNRKCQMIQTSNIKDIFDRHAGNVWTTINTRAICMFYSCISNCLHLCPNALFYI